MSGLVRKRFAWRRYVVIALWVAWWWGHQHAEPHALPYPIFLVFCIGGAVGIWLFGRKYAQWQRQGDVVRLDKKIAAGKKGHVRGTALVTSEELGAVIEAQGMGLSPEDVSRKAHLMVTDPRRHPRNPRAFDGWVKLAGVPVPPAVENLHFAIAASTGAGKSVTLRGLLADIRRRGDRAIVIDNGGEFMRDFGTGDDLVLSPFDDRSLGWNLCNEVRAPHDWARLSRSVVPDGHGSEKPWHEMAQALLANIGAKVGGDNAQLLEIATSFTPAMLAPILAGTASAILTQEGGERLLTNIRSVYGTALASWPYMRAGDFSLRDYMQGDEKRWLFVPFKESEFGVSRSLIATWMDILVSAGLEREEGGQQTWLIIDELDTLGAMSSLIAATTKLRKRKVAVVVAFQSISQLESNYGAERATTLLNCFSSKVILRSVDGDTAERLSKELGEREAWKHSISEGGGGGSVSRSQQLERLVLASQIQSLPDLHGFVKLAGDYPVAKCLASVDTGSAREAA